MANSVEHLRKIVEKIEQRMALLATKESSTQQWKDVQAAHEYWSAVLREQDPNANIETYSVADV